MGGNSRSEKRRGRRWLLTGTVGVLLLVPAAFYLRDWIPGPWRSSEAWNDRLPSDVLADYVPEDSAALLTVDVPSLRESPMGRKRLVPLVQQLVREGEGELSWIAWLGIDPLNDLDSLQISFASGGVGQPLWLARGRLDRSRFHSTEQAREITVDHFRMWEYRDRQTKRTTTLAAAGDALLASETPARVLAALKYARKRPAGKSDAPVSLREMLTKVDRRQSVWVAASLEKLGSVRRIDNFWLEAVLRPLLTHAASVYGGITCGEDVRADLHFHAATEENAERLEADLKSLREMTGGASLFLGRQHELLPLLLLLGAAETNRDGNNVSLHCRLSEEQWPR